jgi:hypothetical protein
MAKHCVMSSTEKQEFALDGRTALEAFHFHAFDAGGSFTEPPIGEPDGHRHEILRDEDNRVTGFGEAAGHTHGLDDEVMPFKARKQRKGKLYELTDVEIFRTGTWNGDEFTEDDLEQIVSNFGRVGFRPPVKLGHAEKSGDAAFGWVKALRRKGDRLVADFMDLPRSVFDAIRDRKFDRVSSEIFFNLKRNNQTFRRALKAVALLGAETPAVSDLAPLRESFTVDELGAVHAYSLPTDALSTSEGSDMSTEHDDLEAQVKALQEENAKLKQTDSAVELQAMQDEIKALKAKAQAAADRAHTAMLAEKVDAVRRPTLRPHFRALYDAFGDTERTVKFTVSTDAGSEERDAPVMDVLDDLVRRLNKEAEGLFSEMSVADRNARDESGDSPGERVHAKTVSYMAEHKMADTSENYAEAQRAVLALSENRDLKIAYANGGH